jgi:hypothetical membrane protein
MKVTINSKINRYFNALIILFFSTFGLSMLAFADSFSMQHNALSDLGCTRTPTGEPNTIGFIIFACGLALSSGLLFRISRLFRLDDSIRHHRIKQYLCLMGSLGCLLFIFPYNLNDNVHMIGAAMLVGALWAIGSLNLLEDHQAIGNIRFILWMLLLQGSVLTYAAAFAFDLPFCNIAQKFAVSGLGVVIKICMTRVPSPVAPEIIPDKAPIF